MNDILLTVTQALQLVAIAPCLFVIVFLLCTAKKGSNLLPILYFFSLICSFLLPLREIFASPYDDWLLTGVLLLGEYCTPALAFLLILQFLQGRVPPFGYWLILALPLLGGSAFVYASLFAQEACLGANACYATESLRLLFGLFSTALIFLLLIYKLSQASARIAVEDADRRHKYWLILALVLLHLAVAGLNLLFLAGMITAADMLLIITAIRIAFIYLVLTSIFRVFYDLFDIDLAPAARLTHPARVYEQDVLIVEQLKALLEQEHIYREMGLTRAMVAGRLGISEHSASRIVNAYLHKNFNELINTYRVEEAKRRLCAEETAITVIAFEVGFNSIASFNRVFKELSGTSPSEYRSRHKANR